MQKRASGGGGRKVQLVAGATSFAEGEARLAPRDSVQMEKDPAAPAETPAAEAKPAAAGKPGPERATPKTPSIDASVLSPSTMRASTWVTLLPVLRTTARARMHPCGTGAMNVPCSPGA